MDTTKEDIVNKVEKALDGIRPYLATDGGNVKVLDIDENMVVRLELLGACGNCPMSLMTMKAGIEETIKRQVPEVTNVQAINLTDHDDPNARLPNNFS